MKSTKQHGVDRSEWKTGTVTSSAGFTLLELMVVLVIIAMMSTLITPSIASALREKGPVATANNLSELLRFAHLSAITRHRSVVVNLDSSRGKCWVTVTRTSFPWLPDDEVPQTRILEAMELPEGTELIVTRGPNSPMGVDQSAAWETITFGSDGMTEDTVIELVGPGRDRFQIDVYGVTGEVHVREVVQ